jgi:hypothetical protein
MVSWDFQVAQARSNGSNGSNGSSFSADLHDAAIVAVDGGLARQGPGKTERTPGKILWTRSFLWKTVFRKTWIAWQTDRVVSPGDLQRVFCQVFADPI